MFLSLGVLSLASFAMFSLRRYMSEMRRLIFSVGLKQRRYMVNGRLDNQRRTYQFDETINPRLFSPNALHYYVR